MRLICIPHWLAKTAAVHHAPHTSFVDLDYLSKHLSKSDLTELCSLTAEIGGYLEKRLMLPKGVLTNGCPSPVGEPQLYWYHRPVPDVSTAGGADLLSVIHGGERIENRLAGRNLPSGFGVTFSIKQLDGPWEEPTVGVFARIVEYDAERFIEADKQFLTDLVELFYANYGPACRVAKHPLMNAFICGIC